jgi:hypothetical protein
LPKRGQDIISASLFAMVLPGAGRAILVIVVSALFGCAAFMPQPLEGVEVLERPASKEDGKVWVTAAVPSPEESAALFGVDVAARGIQPVWLRLENHDDVDYFWRCQLNWWAVKWLPLTWCLRPQWCSDVPLMAMRRAQTALRIPPHQSILQIFALS